MKLLSNFDTNIENTLLEEYRTNFGTENVVAVHKSRYYYNVFILSPAIILTFTTIGVIFALYIYVSDQVALLIPCILILLIYVCYSFNKLFGRYFNYKLDFLIVTPKEIIKYDQEGLFHRDIERINASKIKSISIKKDGFLASLFDVGTITFLAEAGDFSGDGDMKMDMVNIAETEKSIRHVLQMDRN